MSNEDCNDLSLALTGFGVTKVLNDVNAQHPRFSQFKRKESGSNQIERRRSFLEKQKEQRFKFQQLLRHKENGSADNDESMEWSMGDKKPRKYPRKYANQLMLSEWLVEVPDDLEFNWLMVLCPIGKRTLVIASNGTTSAYTRSGYCINNGFPSHLPGGYRKQQSEHGMTAIDCIFDEQKRIYYVLDILCWNGHDVCDSDTEFRFYWLHTKLEEVESLKQKASSNPYPFLELPKTPCSMSDIKTQLWDPFPFTAELDGVLFFHKLLKYESGATPLIGWLKGYMVPEILNIDVPDMLKKQAPSDYVSMVEQLPKAFEKHAQRNIRQENEMDISEQRANESSAFDEPRICKE